MASYTNFTNMDLFFTDDSIGKPYTKRGDKLKTTVHLGQVKLMMNDVMFLNYFWDPSEVPHPVFISVGAASGQHYPVLAKMFPMCHFHLYDPSPFKLGANPPENITVYNQYFTNETAASWSGRNDVFFTSDIRRYGQFSVQIVSGELNLETTIREDMSMQQEWVEIIDPVKAMLKFRLPYIDPDAQGNIVDVPYEYLDGYLAKQQWQSVGSTECRLIPIKRNGQYVKRMWSPVKRQDQSFWFNSVERESLIFKNPFTERPDPINGIISNRYDSLATAVLLKNYLVKISGGIPTTQEAVFNLFESILDGINENLVESGRINKEMIFTATKYQTPEERRQNNMRQEAAVRRKLKGKEKAVNE